jgi:uncharacterized membrane protein YdbT with pleckstrin-like domain
LNIEQTGLFKRVIAELRLYRIQDVSSTVKGMIPTFFNYGNVDIQTASNEDHFNFEQIPNPTYVSKMIMEYAEKDRQNNIDSVMDDFSSGRGKEGGSAVKTIPL